MNSFLLSGEIVREPRYSAGGKSPVLSFTVLSIRKWQDREFKTYGEVVVFGANATALNGTLTQGDYVICQGSAEAEHYESKGEYKAKLRCAAMSVEKVAGTGPATRPIPKPHPDTVAPSDGDDQPPF